MGHRGGEAVFGIALSPPTLWGLGAAGSWGSLWVQSSMLHPPKGGLRVSCGRSQGTWPLWRPGAGKGALNELGEGLPISLHSSKSPTHGAGLSMGLGLGDLPELELSFL